MVWHGCTLTVWSNNSQDSTWTPCDVRTGIVRATHGNLQCFSYPTGPLRTRKAIDTTRIWKDPARASYVAVRGLYGPITGCSLYLNPYGARRLIMNALKLHGDAIFVRRRNGQCGGRTIFVQNSPGTARAGPGVWCDWGISTQLFTAELSFCFMGLKYSLLCSKWMNENQGAVSIRKTVLPGMAIPMLKIRRPNGRLIFNMEIAIRR